jgi:hypothetical protein
MEMARFRLTFACAVTTALALLPPARVSSAEPEKPGQPYSVGVNGAYLPNLKQETLRRWVRESGATMPRVGMRMDLFQKGMPDHPDAWVSDAAKSGGSALAMLFNESQPVTRPDGTRDEGCKPPAGLGEPVFDNGTDDAGPGAKINPKNEWAVFVAATAERYDGDGVADAPGSPKVTWFSVWNEPDWLPWPARPKSADDKTMRNWFGRDFHDLARLAFVSFRAAKFAHPNAKVGMQLCFNQSLGLLLDDPKYPLAKNCDFVDFHAYGGKTGDDNCFRNDGIVPVLKEMRGEYEKRKLQPPDFLCSETGVGGDAPGSEKGMTQAAAAIKANVVGASAGLVTTCWYALVDPSWENMGLIADASKLPPDGAGAQFREAYTAMQTAGLLLNGAKFVAEVPAGEGNHAYRFRDRAGRDLYAVWLDDSVGVARHGPAAVPLGPGAWEIIYWDFAIKRVPEGRIEAEPGRKVLETNVGTMPGFYRSASTLP